MTWELYLLSILDSVKTACAISSVVGFAVMVLFGIGYLMHCDDDRKDEKVKESNQEGRKTCSRIFMRAFYLSILPILIFLTVPSRTSLVKSYLILEGKEVITSENADALFQKLDEKSERFLDILGKKGAE